MPDNWWTGTLATTSRFSFDDYVALRRRTTAPRTQPRWLWERHRDGWKLLTKIDSKACFHISRCRIENSRKMYRLTKTNRPPRSVDTPEIKDPFT